MSLGCFVLVAAMAALRDSRRQSEFHLGYRTAYRDRCRKKKIASVLRAYLRACLVDFFVFAARLYNIIPFVVFFILIFFFLLVST